MPSVTGKTHKFKSEKISGRLYIDNEIALGQLTEVGLDFDEPVTFYEEDRVKRVSMIINHTAAEPSAHVTRLLADGETGDSVKSFDHARDKEIWQWILDHISP